MTINAIKEGKLCKIIPEGRIDTTTAPEFEKSVRDNVDVNGQLEIDFSKVAYISSAGLRVLLTAYKMMTNKTAMKVVNVSQEIYDVLEMTGFTDFLNVEQA